MSIVFMSAMLCFGLSACSNNDDATTPEDTPAKEYMVSIGFKGEISISEAPLGRASGNDLYGIQVYSYLADNEGQTYQPYAYGLFDDISTMNIKLIEGYEYDFVATMVPNGKEILAYSNNTGYSYPFVTSTKSKVPFNIFQYSYTTRFISLHEGNSTLITNKKYGIPNIDRYYGEFTNYTPSENGNVAINMLRTVFGLKVIANNLTDGTINITMENAPEMKITYPSTEIEDIFTFINVGKVYFLEDYSDARHVTFTWERNNDETIPLGTYEITFKRNKQTIVTLELDDTTDEEKNMENALSLSIDSEKMTEGDKYTIEDKEITNNTITPGTSE